MQFYPYLCRKITIIITIALMKPDALAVANYLLQLAKEKGIDLQPRRHEHNGRNHYLCQKETTI